MVKGFRTYSTTFFVFTPLPLPFVPTLSSLSACTPLMQNCPFSMPKTRHCEHTPKCASASACRAKRCRQKKAARQHEAEAWAMEQHSIEAADVSIVPLVAAIFRAASITAFVY